MMGNQHSVTPIYDQIMTEVSRQRDRYMRTNALMFRKDLSDVFEIYVSEKTHHTIMKEIYNARGVSPPACEYFHNGTLFGSPVYLARANVYGNTSEQGKSPPMVRVLIKS